MGEVGVPCVVVAPIVGIDLGTTNSLVAVSDAAGARIINDEQGRALVPSAVRYEAAPGHPGFRTVVGYDARERAQDFPLTTVLSVKRLMGRSVQDAASDLRYLSYSVVPGERGTARVVVPLDGRAVLCVHVVPVVGSVVHPLTPLSMLSK